MWPNNQETAVATHLAGRIDPSVGFELPPGFSSRPQGSASGLFAQSVVIQSLQFL